MEGMKIPQKQIDEIAKKLNHPLRPTFPRETVWRLMRHIEALGMDIDRLTENVAQLQRELNDEQADNVRAVAAADRLEDEAIKNRQEILRLQDEVDEAREGRKVPVPRAVADAFENLPLRDSKHRRAWAAVNILHNDEMEIGPNARIIKRHFRGDPYELMEFFVNGYTVEDEPSTEDKLRKRFADMLARCDTRPDIGNDTLATMLVVEVREVLAEERKQESEH